MKKILFFVAVALLIAACKKKDEPENPASQTSFAKATLFEALGTNTVPNVEGEQHHLPYSLDSVRVEAVIVTDSTLDIKLYGINFSSKMPVTIDMVIPAVSYTRIVEKITISGDSIIPTMGGNPFNRYAIYDLSGTITADSFTFTNTYGTYTGCTYAGKITKMQ